MYRWKRLAARRAVESAITFLASPFVGGVTTLCIIAAGALASFFPETIKDNMSLTLYWRGISMQATSFWLLVGFSGMLFSGAQWAQAKRAQQASDSLNKAVARLATLPTETYLPSYQAAFREAGLMALLAIADDSIGEEKLESVELAIKGILRAVVE